MTWEENQYLIHYGVKGMEWGKKKSPGYEAMIKRREAAVAAGKGKFSATEAMKQRRDAAEASGKGKFSASEAMKQRRSAAEAAGKGHNSGYEQMIRRRESANSIKKDANSASVSEVSNQNNEKTDEQDSKQNKKFDPIEAMLKRREAAKAAGKGVSDNVGRDNMMKRLKDAKSMKLKDLQTKKKLDRVR